MMQAKLKDLFDYLPKSKVQAGDGLEEGMYPFYTSSENQTKYLNGYQHGPGCLVFGTGGKASVHFTTSHFSTSTDCITIKPKPEVEIDAGYVYQYFKGNMQILEHGFKGAGLKHISKAYLSDIQIPYPKELDDQIRIAHLLGKVEGLVAQRKQHLQQLDDLLKSVFMEMFGPTSPDYEVWPLVKIYELAAKHKGAMRTGPFGSNLLHSEFTSEGDVAVLGIDNAVQNRFAWGERRFISNEKYQELQSYRVFPRDVVVTIMGTIGRSVVIPDDIPLAINTKHLAAITLNRELANPLFLSYSIHSSPFVLNQFASKNRGAIMNGLNLSIIKETKIKCPPIGLQNCFAEIHTRVDQLKSRYQHTLSDLEDLYGALSQKAFKGELDLSRVPLPRQSDETLDQTNQENKEPTTLASFQLPEPEAPNWLAAGNRPKLIEFWLTAWCKHYAEESFAASRFLDVAYQRLVELSERDAFQFDKPGKGFDKAKWYEGPPPIGIDEYEQIKKWVFEALASGKLSQAFDNAGNRIQLKAAQA